MPDELLSTVTFDTLAEARCLIDRWRLFYNHRLIERALGKLTPATFAAASEAETPHGMGPIAILYAHD